MKNKQSIIDTERRSQGKAFQFSNQQRRMVIGLFLFTLSLWASADNTNPFTGIWWNENQTLKVRIVADDNVYKGIVVWKSEASEAKMKEGDVFLKALKPNGDLTRLEDGIIGNENRSAKCTITPAGKDKLEVKMSKGFLFKTVTWTKAEEE
ncbi:DUF2147 domain-containing protein [Marinilabiliaceae bacterium JC017]|nr:DUF2147 domain-containing protein [Marinilabiliaceae bacterium JC017]